MWPEDHASMMPTKRDLAADLACLESQNDFWQISRDSVLLQLVKEDPVLDLGCGMGVITRPLMERGFKVYSTDIDPACCEATKKINKNTFCEDFVKMNTKKLPLFRSIVLADVLEHIPDDEETLRKANQLLQRGGKVVISVPYHQFFWTKNDFVRHHVRRY